MSKKKYYIAYGSNLSVGQMAYRCPDAKVIGTAVIEDYALLFKGCATIEQREGKKVPVLIWEISPVTKKTLTAMRAIPTFTTKRI